MNNFSSGTAEPIYIGAVSLGDESIIGNSSPIGVVSGMSYFNVCVCNPNCKYNELFKVAQNYNISLYVENDKGEIIPITEEMVRKSTNEL